MIKGETPLEALEERRRALFSRLTLQSLGITWRGSQHARRRAVKQQFLVGQLGGREQLQVSAGVRVRVRVYIHLQQQSAGVCRERQKNCSRVCRPLYHACCMRSSTCCSAHPCRQRCGIPVPHATLLRLPQRRVSLGRPCRRCPYSQSPL